MKNEESFRESLADFLGLLETKVRNGVLTFDDVQTMNEVIRHTGGVKATVRDLSDYYGQTENNIRHIIHRNLLPAPKRRVYYDFFSFRNKIPSKWTK